MIQRLTWKVTPPPGHDVDSACEVMVPPAEKILKNSYVEAVEIHLEEDHLLLVVSMQGRDRWWISRRAPYLVAAILTQSRLGTGCVEFTQVETLPNLKSARYWTEPGKTGKRVFDPPDGQQPRHTVRVARKAKDPAHWLHRSGWHQDYQGQGR